jgi:hypothetical protein
MPYEVSSRSVLKTQHLVKIFLIPTKYSKKNPALGGAKAPVKRLYWPKVALNIFSTLARYDGSDLYLGSATI